MIATGNSIAVEKSMILCTGNLLRNCSSKSAGCRAAGWLSARFPFRNVRSAQRHKSRGAAHLSTGGCSA